MLDQLGILLSKPPITGSRTRRLDLESPSRRRERASYANRRGVMPNPSIAFCKSGCRSIQSVSFSGIIRPRVSCQAVASIRFRHRSAAKARFQVQRSIDEVSAPFVTEHLIHEARTFVHTCVGSHPRSSHGAPSPADRHHWRSASTCSRNPARLAGPQADELHRQRMDRSSPRGSPVLPALQTWPDCGYRPAHCAGGAPNRLTATQSSPEAVYAVISDLDRRHAGTLTPSTFKRARLTLADIDWTGLFQPFDRGIPGSARNAPLPRCPAQGC